MESCTVFIDFSQQIFKFWGDIVKILGSDTPHNGSLSESLETILYFQTSRHNFTPLFSLINATLLRKHFHIARNLECIFEELDVTHTHTESISSCSPFNI